MLNTDIPDKFFFNGYIKKDAGILYSCKGDIFCKAEVKSITRFYNPFLRYNSFSTDLSRKKKMRNEKLRNFKEYYQPLLIEKKISVIAMIIWADEIKNLKKYIKNFKNVKLKKFGINASTHCYICDIGKESLRPHWHVFIVTQPFSESLYSKIFKQKDAVNKVSGIPMNDTFNLIDYCIAKDFIIDRRINRGYFMPPKLELPYCLNTLLITYSE